MSLQSRFADLIMVIGADVKALKTSSQTFVSSTAPIPTGYSARNILVMTAQSTSVSLEAPSGVPIEGNSLMVRIKDDGNTRNVVYDAVYRSLNATNMGLPLSTIANKWTYLGFSYNATDVKWDLIALVQQT